MLIAKYKQIKENFINKLNGGNIILTNSHPDDLKNKEELKFDNLHFTKHEFNDFEAIDTFNYNGLHEIKQIPSDEYYQNSVFTSIIKKGKFNFNDPNQPINCEVLDDKQINDIKTKLGFDEQNKKQKHDEKNIALFVLGPPCSGKTTIINKIMKEKRYEIKNFININPDLLRLNFKEYVDGITDVSNNEFMYNSNKNILLDGNCAEISRDLTYALIELCIEKKLNFILDIAGRDKNYLSSIIGKCILGGYFVLLLYVTTSDLDINVYRCNKRMNIDGRYVDKNYLKNAFKETNDTFEDLKNMIESKQLINIKTEEYKNVQIEEYKNDCLNDICDTYSKQINILKLENFDFSDNMEKEIETFQTNLEIYKKYTMYINNFNFIDYPINDTPDNLKYFVENFCKNIFENISKQPYLNDPNDYIRLNDNSVIYRPNHNGTNHLRSMRYCIELLKFFKENKEEEFNILFGNKQFLLFLILASLFISICRIDEAQEPRYKLTKDCFNQLFPEIFKEKCDYYENFGDMSFNLLSIISAFLFLSIIKNIKNVNLTDIEKEILTLSIFNGYSGQFQKYVENGFKINDDLCSKITVCFILLRSGHYLDHWRGRWTQALYHKTPIAFKKIINISYTQETKLIGLMFDLISKTYNVENENYKVCLADETNMYNENDRMIDNIIFGDYYDLDNFYYSTNFKIAYDNYKITDFIGLFVGG